MSNKTQSYNIRNIRKFINKYFDDTSLETFCRDYFYEVFNRFARGLRKNEKINLLLDHCRRRPNGFEKLFEALQEHYEDDDAMLSEFAKLYAQSTQSQSTHTRPFNPPKAAAAKQPQPVVQQPTPNAPATSSVTASGANNISSDNTASTPTMKEKVLSAFRDPMWQTAGAIFTIIGVLYTLGLPISLPDFSTPTNTPTMAVPVSTSTLTPTVVPTQTPANTPVPPTETGSETDTP